MDLNYGQDNSVQVIANGSECTVPSLVEGEERVYKRVTIMRGAVDSNDSGLSLVVASFREMPFGEWGHRPLLVWEMGLEVSSNVSVVEKCVRKLSRGF
jgi:hypothetical protein